MKIKEALGQKQLMADLPPYYLSEFEEKIDEGPAFNDVGPALLPTFDIITSVQMSRS